MKTIHKLLIALGCASAVPEILHAQGVEWATLIEGVEIEHIYAICHDGSGNTYATGRMSSGSIGAVDVSVHGTYDIFLAKINLDGECDWVVTAGGSDQNDLNEGDWGLDAIYDDVTHSIYICGLYQAMAGAPAVFGPGITVFGEGSFLARYDTTGTCLWMRAADNGQADGLAVDGSGAVYVTGGSTSGQTTFFGAPSVTVPSGPFLAKYSSAGLLIWAKSPGHGVGGKVCAREDRLYFGGATSGIDRSFVGMDLPDEPVYISFLAEVDTGLTTIQWIDVYGTNNAASIMELEMNENGELLLAGSFQDSLFLPTDTLVETFDGYGQFCLQTDDQGQILWAKSIGVETLYARAISASPDGSSYIGFAFSGALTTSLGTMEASAIHDYAVLHFAPNGSLVGMMNNGPVGPGICAMDVLADNNVVVGYMTWGNIDLGNGYLLEAGADAFVAKLGVITSVPTLKASVNGELLIYANPNNGTCSIELPEALQGRGGLTLRILDAEGRVVQQSPLSFDGGVVRLDIRAQAKGTYVAEVSNARQRYTGRIVFE